MRTPLRRAQARRVRRQMDRLSGQILRSIADEPDGFEERQDLWMQREALRDQYHRLNDGGTA